MPQPSDNEVLERDLDRSLARRPVPAGLSSRVMRRIRAEPERAAAPLRPARFVWPRFRWRWALAAAGAAAALLLALATLPWRLDREPERAAGQQAERELAEALQLAGRAWNQAQQAAFEPPRENQHD